jgi:hypothetical protein
MFILTRCIRAAASSVNSPASMQEDRPLFDKPLVRLCTSTPPNLQRLTRRQKRPAFLLEERRHTVYGAEKDGVPACPNSREYC